MRQETLVDVGACAALSQRVARTTAAQVGSHRVLARLLTHLLLTLIHVLALVPLQSEPLSARAARVCGLPRGLVPRARVLAAPPRAAGGAPAPVHVLGTFLSWLGGGGGDDEYDDDYYYDYDKYSVSA